MLLSREDIHDRMRTGELAVTPQQKVGRVSVDLSMGTLYRNNDRNPFPVEVQQQEYIARHLTEVSLDTLHIIRPGEFYLWQPDERVFLGRNLRGRITSRSSWARIGVRVDGASDDYLRRSDKDRDWRPLCTMNTGGTHVVIRRGDVMAQLSIHDDTGGVSFVSTEDLKSMVDSETVSVRKNGIFVPSSCLEFPGEMELTMDDEILLYTGILLDPHDLSKQAFKRLRIPEEGIPLPYGSFFLSASQEHITLPEGYIAEVGESRSAMSMMDYFRDGGNVMPFPFYAHCNAPLVSSNGTITFENSLRMSARIRSGIPQSEIWMHKLLTPYGSDVSSQYDNQNGVCPPQFTE